MSAWGKTGRVTLGEGGLPSVMVDDEFMGYLYAPDDNYQGWGARNLCSAPGSNGKWFVDHLPTLDAAVLWVLRRVDPALWRQERGAWLVRKVRGGEYVEDGWYTRTRYPAFPGWAIVDPDGKCRASAVSMTSAANAARRYAAEAVAR